MLKSNQRQKNQASTPQTMPKRYNYSSQTTLDRTKTEKKSRKTTSNYQADSSLLDMTNLSSSQSPKLNFPSHSDNNSNQFFLGTPKSQTLLLDQTNSIQIKEKNKPETSNNSFSNYNQVEPDLIETLQSQNKSLKDSIRMKDDELLQLNGKLRKAVRRIKKHKIGKEIAEQELESRKDEISQFQNENDEKDKIISQLYSEIQSMKESDENVHSELKRITDLYQQMETIFGNQIKSLQSKARQVQDDCGNELKKMKNNIILLQNENDSLKNNLKEKHQFSKTESINEIEDLKAQNSFLLNKNRELMDENANFRKQLSSIKESKISSPPSASKLQAALKEKDQIINQLQNEIDLLSKSANPLNREENIDANLNSTQNQIKELKEANKKLKDDLQKQQKSFEIENQRLLQQIQSLNGVSAMNNSLIYQLNELQNENSRMKENLGQINSTTFGSDTLLHEIRFGTLQKENQQSKQAQSLLKMKDNSNNSNIAASIQNENDISVLNSMTNDSLVKEVLKLRAQNEALKKEIDKINTQSVISNIDNNTDSVIIQNQRISNLLQSDDSFEMNNNDNENKSNDINKDIENKANEDAENDSNSSYSTFDEDSILRTIKKQQKVSGTINTPTKTANRNRNNNPNIPSYIDESIISIIQENPEFEELVKEYSPNSNSSKQSKSIIENNNPQVNTEIKDEITEEESENDDNNIEEEAENESQNYGNDLEKRYQSSSNVQIERENEEESINDDNKLEDYYHNSNANNEEETEEESYVNDNKIEGYYKNDNVVNIEEIIEEESVNDDNNLEEYYQNDDNNNNKGENEEESDNNNNNLQDYYQNNVINNEEESEEESINNNNIYGGDYKDCKMYDIENEIEEESNNDDILSHENKAEEESNNDIMNFDEQNEEESNDEIINAVEQIRKESPFNSTDFMNIDEKTDDENNGDDNNIDEQIKEAYRNSFSFGLNNDDHHNTYHENELQNDDVIQNESDDLLRSDSDNDENFENENDIILDKKVNEEEEGVELILRDSPHSNYDQNSRYNNDSDESDQNVENFFRKSMNSNNSGNFSKEEVPQEHDDNNNDSDNNLSQQLDQVCSENKQLKEQNSILHDEISDLQEHLQNLVSLQLHSTLADLNDVQQGSKELRQRSYNLELLQEENSYLKHRVINLEAQNIDLRQIIIDSGTSVSENNSKSDINKSNNNSQLNSIEGKDFEEDQNQSINSNNRTPNKSKSNIVIDEDEIINDDNDSLGILKEKTEQMRSVINTIRNDSSASSTADDDDKGNTTNNNYSDDDKKNSPYSPSSFDYKTVKRENAELKEIINKLDLKVPGGNKSGNDAINDGNGYNNTQLIDKVQQLEATNAELVQRIEEFSQNESQIVDRYEEENQGLRARISHLENQLNEAVEAEAEAREIAIAATAAAVEASYSTANSSHSFNNSNLADENEGNNSFHVELSPQFNSSLSPSQREEIHNVFEGFKSQISDLQQSLSDIQKENSILEAKMNEQMANASAAELELKQESEALKLENQVLRSQISTIQSSFINQDDDDEEEEDDDDIADMNIFKDGNDEIDDQNEDGDDV